MFVFHVNVCLYVYRYERLWFHKFNAQKLVDVLLDCRRHILCKRQEICSTCVYAGIE